ncbi:OmpA/MotB [Novosphingobium nitrogenifigens DSM 19370]|uniref:Peptidoglycan-associated lipoprotein n=1 Tax=Novosphingobium nitrogenifigens DSM 19370 TaxID=983920 RepID=F1ZBX3_9SPHN|nr:peptidoglycan-associated lipoprotein Pal [Novosphingobium nitrogenifigens]EGD57951.1 OmpA/MotB [Novosphingobium nitrogenifigens DSM 19370]
MTPKILTASVVLASLALAGCAGKPKELPPQPEAATTTRTPPPPPTPAPAGPVPGSQADFLASVISDTIHFELDKYNVDTESQGILQSQAQWLAKYPGKKITIEGHCDERGTREYNLALGERRANAAKTYLVGLGVDASRINTVSYGKERPIALGSDEASWAKNRRAVTITVE